MRKTEGQLVACICTERRDPECEAASHPTMASKLQMQLLFANINHHIMIDVYKNTDFASAPDLLESNVRSAMIWHYDDCCELEVKLDKHYLLESDWSDLDLSEMFREL